LTETSLANNSGGKAIAINSVATIMEMDFLTVDLLLLEVVGGWLLRPLNNIGIVRCKQNVFSSGKDSRRAGGCAPPRRGRSQYGGVGNPHGDYSHFPHPRSFPVQSTVKLNPAGGGR
jgi:hypothetical protein